MNRKTVLCALLVFALLCMALAACAPANEESTSVVSTASPSYEPAAPSTAEVLDIVYTPDPTPIWVGESAQTSSETEQAPSQNASQGQSASQGEQSVQAEMHPESAQDGQPVRMRGVWVASVLNIDFPSRDSIGNEEAQRAEIIRILDNTVSWNLDTVFFQVRPMGDALYRSAINPWSSFLSGTQGTDPGWDPLAFVIEEAHARGLSLHAWLNPYRVTHASAQFTTANLAEGSLARQHPEWLIAYEGITQYDPAREEVKQHIVDTVQEIVSNYDVDGIHFDDYFYPSGYPLPDGAEKDGVLDRERREHVNDMIRRVNAVCKAAPHKVVFGISPFGIWKNNSSDPNGSDTAGAESYYDLAADSVRWIQEGIIDYIAPQIYWPIGHEKANYDTLLHWWANQTSGTSVSLIVGQGVSDPIIVADIQNELALNATVPEVTGSIFFNYSALADDPQLAETVRAFYAG